MSIFVVLLGFLSFLAVFTTIVFVHEMGHFLTARALGFKVDAFSIGFGKAIWQRRDSHGTLWKISQLPLGGYVKFAGDQGAASVPDREKLAEMKNELADEGDQKQMAGIFHFMPVWKRVLVTAAGPLMNFVFAILVFTALLMGFGKTYIAPEVGSVAPNSAAFEAGFIAGDLIVSANGEDIKSFSRLGAISSVSANDPIEFKVRRADQIVTIIATPRAIVRTDILGKQAKMGQLGIGSVVNAQQKQERYGPARAFGESLNQTGTIITDQVAFVGRIFRGKGSPEMLGGPLRILFITAKVGAGDLNAGDTTQKDNRTLFNRIFGLVHLMAVLSVAIGLINLAPVPILDGGHLVFYAFEAVMGRPLQERVQIIGFKVGIIAVICLLAFATFNDLRYFNVFGFVEHLFS